MMFNIAPLARTADSHPRLGAHTDASRRLHALRDALEAICDGNWDDAQNVLTLDGAVTPRDAALLNLLGVICQGRKDWKEARRFFGKAMRADRRYAPAEHNLRRIYELSTFGQTNLPVALVDDQIALDLAMDGG